MHGLNSSQQPASLRLGARYKLLEVKNDIAHQVTYEDVYFWSYTSAPEMIIVKTENGQMLRVSRHNVYEITLDEDS